MMSTLCMDADTRRRNLMRIKDHSFVGSQAALAAYLGITEGRVSQLLDPAQPFGERAARKYEDRLQFPRGALDADHEGSSPLAHFLRHPPDRLVPNQIGWEALMRGDDLPERFVTAIPDDSGGPDYPAGTRIIWSTRKSPNFGSLVLIRDEHGQTHVREYHQGQAPGQWFARPLAARGFATYDGSMVQIVAVGDEVLRRLP